MRTARDGLLTPGARPEPGTLARGLAARLLHAEAAVVTARTAARRAARRSFRIRVQYNACTRTRAMLRYVYSRNMQELIAAECVVIKGAEKVKVSRRNLSIEFIRILRAISVGTRKLSDGVHLHFKCN